MWLIEFHAAVSILCYITVIGFKTICRETIIDNGWEEDGKKKRGMRSVKLLASCLVPVVNIFNVLAIFTMISVRKEDYEKLAQEKRKEK